MEIRNTILATLVGAMALFLWDGAFQAIPSVGIRAVERLESNALTTPKFQNLTNRMVYLVTDHTVSFIATKRADYYDLTRFFVVEFGSAFVVAALFAVLFSMVPNLHLKQRQRMVLLISGIAIFAIHIPYFNWWGFSMAYTLGVMAKTLLGWQVMTYIQNRFIFKIK